MSYLAKRGSVYYFRRIVPDELRLALGKREIMLSLRTKDREEAKRLIPKEIIKSDALFANARKGSVSDQGKSKPPAAKSPAQLERERLIWEADLEQIELRDQALSDQESEIEELEPIMTLVRVGVLRAAPWSEFQGIDWDDPDTPPDQPIWRIPASRMKLVVEDKENPAFGHDVPLCHQAVEVLRIIRMITGSLPILFPSAKGWRQPMSDAALSTMYKRMAGGRYQGQMVPHGWRSSFSTIMNERAADLERDGDRMVIDMILAHVPEGVSASEWSYNRSRYRRLRTSLHQVWADLISEGLMFPHELLSREKSLKGGTAA